MKKPMKKEKMKSEKVRMSLLLPFSLLLFTFAANAATAAELPEGYTAVEWIESSGGAYIDTGYHPTLKTRIEADFNPLERERWGSFFGLTAEDQSLDGILMRYYDAEDKLNGWFCNENYHEAQIGGVANNRIQVELKAGGMTVGGSSAEITTTGTPYDGSIYIFSVNCNSRGGPYRSHAMRLYSFTIYDTVGDGSEGKLRDFVPCVRKSDFAVGLYDLAASDPGDAFYANAGNGKFVVPEGTFCTVTVGPLKNMTAAYTFGDGSVTNDVEGTTFEVLPGTKNLTVVFTAADGCRFADDSTVKTVTRDEATGDLDLAAETPVAHRVQPTATITKITNRYPWNGKIDVEYELSYLELAFSPIDAIVTKFTSGDIEVTKTNDLSDAELAARTAQRTFDCRELFGEGKRDAEAQSSATLVMPDYAVIDISCGASVNSYPVTYHKSAPEGGWNTDEYKTDKIVLYYVKAGTYKGNQCKDQTTMGFWIGVFPVTEAQYANVMGGSGSTTQPKTIVSYTTLRGTDNSSATVAGESFLKRLCDRTGLNGFDLPTESQWEIACRAGTTSDNYWGDDQSDKYMWNSGNSSQEVGQKLPNAWGLYDMMGNVWEWCRDGYHTSFTVDLSADVCIEPSTGYYHDYRFLRGCSFSSSMFGVKSSARNVDAAGNFNSDWGFRLSRMSSNESAALSVGPSFSFDTRAEKTIAGTETLTYSGDDWGAGGTGVTVWYSLDGGETIELKTATDSGTVSWTPTLNGRYEFGHVVTDGTTETAVLVVNGLPGGEANPWEIGEGVTAYVKDHVLYLKGEGKVDEFADGAPWAGYDDLLTGIGPLSRAITLPASVAATLPISVEGGVPSGAISPAEFEQMQIIDGRAYLGVSVCTNGDVTATTEGWQKAAIEEAQVEEDGTVTLTVPATAEKGFMILKSKGAVPSDAPHASISILE